MLKVVISGPQGKGKTQLRQQIATLLQSSGKVVRVYEESVRPEVLPTDADVIIIVEQT